MVRSLNDATVIGAGKEDFLKFELSLTMRLAGLYTSVDVGHFAIPVLLVVPFDNLPQKSFEKLNFPVFGCFSTTKSSKYLVVTGCLRDLYRLSKVVEV